MSSEYRPRFDPPDMAQLRLLAALSSAKRVDAALHAQHFTRAVIWGRLRWQYPQATQEELTAKFIEEVLHARAARP